MSDERKEFTRQFVDDVFERLQQVENDYEALKKEMALGEVTASKSI